MIVGTVRELKIEEYRIGLTPDGVRDLTRAGHRVTVFEKGEKPGGLLRYGIPDFKLEKRIIDRRLEQMRLEGAEFQTGVAVGEDVSARYLDRTVHYVSRVGLDYVKARVVEDAENRKALYARLRYALESGDSVLAVPCRGLTQARVVLVPVRR